MSFKDEWVDLVNKTPTAPGSKVRAEDLNLLARGINEALEKMPEGKIPAKVSDLVNDLGFVSGDFVPKYGALKIEGDVIGGTISAINPDDPTKSYLELRTYLLSIYASVVNIDATLNVTGFLNAYGINIDDDSIDSERSAVNKKYVDELVGDIKAALDGIIAIEDNYIMGVMAVNEGGES